MVLFYVNSTLFEYLLATRSTNQVMKMTRRSSQENRLESIRSFGVCVLIVAVHPILGWSPTLFATTSFGSSLIVVTRLLLFRRNAGRKLFFVPFRNIIGRQPPSEKRLFSTWKRGRACNGYLSASSVFPVSLHYLLGCLFVKKIQNFYGKKIDPKIAFNGSLSQNTRH